MCEPRQSYGNRLGKGRATGASRPHIQALPARAGLQFEIPGAGNLLQALGYSGCGQSIAGNGDLAEQVRLHACLRAWYGDFRIRMDLGAAVP